MVRTAIPPTGILLSNLPLSVDTVFQTCGMWYADCQHIIFAIGAHPWLKMFQEFACASCYRPTLELLIQPQSPMHQFTRCASYQPDCEQVVTFFSHRVICATRMYRALIDNEMERCGIDIIAP